MTRDDPDTCDDPFLTPEEFEAQARLIEEIEARTDAGFSILLDVMVFCLIPLYLLCVVLGS